MFYKHWKKFALALTGLFWASCDGTSSVEGPDLYGCPPDVCPPMSAMPESSSSVNPLPSSSSNEQIACKRQSRTYDTRENGKDYISVDYYECKDEFNSKYNVENKLID